MTKLITSLIVVFIGVPLVIIYSSFSWGYVAQIFEGWFVIPVFPSFKPITWVQYAGLMCFASTIVRPSVTFMKEEFEEKTNKYAYVILGPWMALLGGWIFKIVFI